MTRISVLALIVLCWCGLPTAAQAENSRLASLKQRHIARYHAKVVRPPPATESIHSHFGEDSSKLATETDEVPEVYPSNPAEPAHSAK